MVRAFTLGTCCVALSLALLLSACAAVSSGITQQQVSTPTPAPIVSPVPTASPGATFSVRTYGALGDGTSLDTAAIDAAITAASGAGGGTVEFPAGTYLTGTIHLQSNVTLQLDAGSTIAGALGHIDPAEPNAFAQYQDYGHSHFHAALIVGENLQNIAIAGSGTLTGNGSLTTLDPVAGQGDKILSLKLDTNVSITGVMFTDSGHFGILANGVSGITIDHVKVLNRNSRDGINLINSSHAIVRNSVIEGRDDAVALKSDFALGRKIASSDIHVSNSTILSTEDNATQIGSETCGDISNVTFSNLTITAGGKAGIGITSNDGAVIDGISYDHITISGAASPIFMKILALGRCPGNPPAGRIQNISIDTVTATHASGYRGEFTNTISGLPGGPFITNVTLRKVALNAVGGHPAADALLVPPERDPAFSEWSPQMMGIRPSYGWYLRHTSNVSFTACSVHFDSNDDRPALIATDAAQTSLDGFIADRGAASAYDLGFSNATYHLTNSSLTTGGALRIQASAATAY